MSKKILFLYAAPDSGHARAAQAVREAFAGSFGVETAGDHVSHYFPFVGPRFVQSYRWMAGLRPRIWGHVYDNAAYARFLHRPEKWLYQFDFFRLNRILKRHRPDAVVATHALPLRALAFLKERGRINIPLFGVLTDFRAHRYWAAAAVDVLFASTEEARTDLTSAGVPAGKVKVTGIPVGLNFKDANKSAVGKPVVAVMGGSQGFMPDGFLKTVLDLGADKAAQWIFVSGGNRSWEKRARGFCGENRDGLRILGYVPDVSSLLQKADLLVTKPGGITSSEALACGVPMVLMRSLAGPEERNAGYLMRRGAALRAPAGAREALDFILRTVKDHSQMEALRRSVLSLARPDAAMEIKNFLLETV